MGGLGLITANYDHHRYAYDEEINDINEVSILELKGRISSCEFDKKILEHEHQKKLLKLDKEKVQYKLLLDRKLEKGRIE